MQANRHLQENQAVFSAEENRYLPKEPAAEEPKKPSVKPVTANAPARSQQEPIVEPPVEDDVHNDPEQNEDDEEFKTKPGKNNDDAEKEAQQENVVEPPKYTQSQSQTTSSSLGSAKKAILELAQKGFNMDRLSQAAAAIGAFAFSKKGLGTAEVTVQGATQTQSLQATSEYIAKQSEVGGNQRDITSHRSVPTALHRNVNASGLIRSGKRQIRTTFCACCFQLSTFQRDDFCSNRKLERN